VTQGCYAITPREYEVNRVARRHHVTILNRTEPRCYALIACEHELKTRRYASASCLRSEIVLLWRRAHIVLDLQVQFASSVRSRQSVMPSQSAPSPTHICPQRRPRHGSLAVASEHTQRTMSQL